jgi:hypothetical protein
MLSSSGLPDILCTVFSSAFLSLLFGDTRLVEGTLYGTLHGLSPKPKF